MVDRFPILRVRDATLAFSDRTLWTNLNLDLHPGEFLAVLGSNGTGKTSLIKTILGQQKLTAGSVELLGKPVRAGSRDIGYIPQQKSLGQGAPVRARDLVGFGIDGHRWGVPRASRARRDRIDEVLESVGAGEYGDSPLSSLSGGEQQRVRVAQAIAGRPRVLLCDEPLLSLDLAQQRSVSELIDDKRRELNTGVVFVTHDVNPILGMVDRVLYLAGGQFRIGTPDEVLRSTVLSYLYNTPVEVIRSRGRIIVIGAPDGYGAHELSVHHDHDEGGA